MPVPSNPQDLINIIREKLFNNTSGLIEEPDLREVLENIVKVLDAKFSFFSPTLTEEQYSQWNLMLDYMLRETKGVLTISSPAPTGTTAKGKYLLAVPGTYTNLGGLVATADKLNYAYFDGTAWQLIERAIPTYTPKTKFDSTDNTQGSTDNAVENRINYLIGNANAKLDLALMPVRRYTGTTTFSDYAAGYQQTLTDGEIYINYPSGGSSSDTIWFNTGKIISKDDKTIVTSTFRGLNSSSGSIGIGYLKEGVYTGYDFSLANRTIRKHVNRTETVLSGTILSAVAVDSTIRFEILNDKLEIYIDGVLFFSVSDVNFTDSTLQLLNLGQFKSDNKIESFKSSFVKNIQSSQLRVSKNLVDKTKIISGYYATTGVFATSANSICTPLIPIDETKGYISLNTEATIGVNERLFFYDVNKNLISSILKTQSTKGVAIPSGTKYASVNIYSITGGVASATDNQFSNTIQLEYGLECTDYESYGEKIKSEFISEIKKPKIVIRGISTSYFYVESLHDNGDYVLHGWKKLTKATQYDNGWYADEILHNGRLVAQGSFNWIHMISNPSNESQHVGHGHGCETDIKADFYIDGVKFSPDAIVGQTIYGSEFSFDIETEIYAADSATTNASYDGSNVVPKLPLIVSTRHYMNGKISANSKMYNKNKLFIMRNGTQFSKCYAGMHLGYRTYFDRIQLHNIENTMNDIQTLTPLGTSTASMNDVTYDTSSGLRAELANSVTSYSDRYGYIFRTTVIPKKEAQKEQMIVQFVNNTSKCYFHPVNIGVRSIPADTFNFGDVLEAEVYRELII